MNINLRHFYRAVFACCGMLTLAAWAQTPNPASDSAAAPASSVSTQTVAAAPASSAVSEQNTPAEPAPPAAVPPSAEPETAAPSSPASAANPATPVPEAAAAAAPVPDAAPAAAEPTLRRLDQPQEAAPADDVRAATTIRRGPYGRSDNVRFAILGNADLGKEEAAEAVVAVVGNATNEGEVDESVVAVLGNARSTGPVGQTVVAIMGNVYVDAEVRQVVAVLGNVELGPNAVVRRDVVSIGGQVQRDPKAIVRGSIPSIGIRVGNLEWFNAYLMHCVRWGRPLAIAPHLEWAWAIAFGFLFFYIVLALLFRGGVDKCVATFETRPGSSILASLLTILLTPILMILLAITVVGLAVVPFFGVALLLATLFGKAVLLAWLGRRITRFFGDGPLTHPAFGVLIGGVIVLGLYLVPVVGFLTYKLLSFLAVGVVVFTLINGRRRQPSVAAAVPVVAAVHQAPPLAGDPGSTAETVPPAVPNVSAASVVGLPRAGFWIRFGAMLIDLIVVSAALLVLHIGPGILLVLAAYGAVMWKVRGTTIGGIICGLQVVRVDGRPVDWPTACVRALSCFISLFAAGLGFIWVALDDEKQSWHDKIAGTTVVLTRANSLV